MAENKPAKKRPRDILASLDAAFASSATTKTSKYTAQAAQQTTAAATQQAYQHKKKKKNQPSQQSQQKPTSVATTNSQNNQQLPQKEKEVYEPLYGRLDVDTLRVGLKNCSLDANANSLRKTSGLHTTLKQYIGSFTNDGNAAAMTDKLKNKVLQFDNPIRTSDAAKQRAVNHAQAQSAKLLSARQRRKLGMHMVASDAIEYSDAEKLCVIWRRYARDVLANDFVGDERDAAARTARLQAKLRTIDLSGCPIEVIKARNPLNVGTAGIIVADKSQVIQLCVPGRSKVITLPKQGLRFRIPVDDGKAFFMDGGWLLGRRVQNE